MLFVLERKSVLEQFNKLKFYIENFKPLAEIDQNNREKMLQFLHQASECHLDLEEFKVQVFDSIGQRPLTVCVLTLVAFSLFFISIFCSPNETNERRPCHANCVQQKDSWKHMNV